MQGLRHEANTAGDALADIFSADAALGSRQSSSSETTLGAGEDEQRVFAFVVQYKDVYRLCYVRGPEGILIGLAEQIG